MAAFNLNTVFKNAFGYEAPEQFTVPTEGTKPSSSKLGQPFYDTDEFGREFFLPVRLDGYLVPFAVMAVTSKKTIVSTPLPERGGTVKELISIDDYVISIKGVLVNDDGNYPDEQIAAVQAIFLKNASVELRSALSDIFLTGEHRVVIREIKWPAVSGIEHVKPFEIDCESDVIFTLEAE